MEKLAWVKTTHNSRIPSPYYSNRLIDSQRKPISINETHLKFGIDFQPIKVQGLALQSSSYDEGGSIAQPGAESLQLSTNLEPISSESQFDRVVAEAQQLEESVVVLWYEFGLLYDLLFFFLLFLLLFCTNYFGLSWFAFVQFVG